MNLLKRNNGLTDTIWSDFFENDLLPSRLLKKEEMPSVNIKNLSNKYELEFALPGIKKEDIEIDLDDNQLVIQGETKSSKSEDGEYTLREFSYQKFHRSFQLPDNINKDEISAKYEDGILKIDVPKLEADKNGNFKRIEIK